ncbi:hypothetical protein GF412_05135 [Candidatus Micrarchaeota archaeon]|nr:hypothetical protein [Candidatus Micrarchaeota archaeon]MBD3418338.1 hypothetical protein [Candidatus Micrarchaeota archaeon]
MKAKLLLFGLFACFLAWGAQDATECELDEESCTFTITLNIAFDSGADDTYIYNAKTEIEDFWNNLGGDQPTVGECKCTVKFVVNTKKVQDCDQEASTEWHCIKVTSYSTAPPKDTRGEKYMGYMYPPGISTGQNLTGWWSDQMSRPAPGGGNYLDFAHEAGHMMGLEDGDGGIMTNTTPGKAVQTQGLIDEIVRDTCKKECPDRCCCGNGEVENDKGEGCDPVATPTGCGSGDYCCPYCCNCYGKQCDPQAGEYATKAGCDAGCKPQNPGETVQCVYSYWTGCWFCIPTGWESLYPETDPDKIREAGKANHDSEGHSKEEPSAQPSTSTKPRVGEESVLDLSQGLASLPMLSGIMGNERINFYIEGLGEYHAALQGGVVVEGGEGLQENPTMNVFSDEQTVEMLYYGDFGHLEALKRELITYEGVGLVEGVKFWAGDFLFDTLVPYDGPGPNDTPEYVMQEDLDCGAGECDWEYRGVPEQEPFEGRPPLGPGKQGTRT